MFTLKRPCTSCPFRKGQGERFQLPRLRLREILDGDGFQCHRTIDYDQFDDPMARQGDRPQQCAGLMALLYRIGRPNRMMQIAARLGKLDCEQLDPQSEAYTSIKELFAAHRRAA